MSVHAIAWALDRDVSATGAKFVLVALANYADENGIAYPSQARLAKLTSQSERAVRGHLAALEKDGFIQRSHRHAKNGARTSDIYELSYRQNLPQAKSATGKKRHNLPAESARKPKEEPKGLYITPPIAPPDEFDVWWLEVPRKVSIGRARKAYRAARKKASAEVLLAGIRHYTAEVRARGSPEFTKHPATWLNGECWNDEPVESVRNGKTDQTQPGGSAERIARVVASVERQRAESLADPGGNADAVLPAVPGGNR